MVLLGFSLKGSDSLDRHTQKMGTRMTGDHSLSQEWKEIMTKKA